MLQSIFLNTLTSQEVIQVKQKRELWELVGFETRNKYSIETEDGRQFGYCAEQQKGFLGVLGRQLIGHWRSFSLLGFDESQQQAFRAKHPFRFFFQRLDVFDRSDRLIGSYQQRFSILSKKFDVLDARGQKIMTMKSPIWKIWTFPLKKGDRQVAVIEKKWSGLLKEAFTDTDNFRVRFSDSYLPQDEKLLILVGAIFVDLLYFEDKAD
jgi:uncharacterized protein YxjI